MSDYNQNFEPIYAALFARLSEAAEFVTKSRRLKSWSEVEKANMPALFVSQMPEEPEQVKGLPTKWNLGVEVYIYVDAGSDETVAPSQLLNPIVGKVRELLSHTSPFGTYTLGGLASHCWISGTVEIADSGLGSVGVAIIPISILVTA